MKYEADTAENIREINDIEAHILNFNNSSSDGNSISSPDEDGDGPFHNNEDLPVNDVEEGRGGGGVGVRSFTSRAAATRRFASPSLPDIPSPKTEN